MLVLAATHAVHPVGAGVGGTHSVLHSACVSGPDPAVHVLVAGSLHV